jgi:hypothetical protein
MKDVELRLESLLAQGFVSRHEASAAALDVSQVLDAAVPDDVAADALRSRFDAAVHAAGFDDLASTQAAYARRLAEAPGQLAYEEMHKLFSLVAELHALERLGYSPAVNSVDELREGLRARFAEQRRVARMVAEDRVQDGLRNLWWFAENLARSDSDGGARKHRP